MESPLDVSVVVPCYGDLTYVPALCAEIAAALPERAVEIILVDDGNPPESARMLEDLTGSGGGGARIRCLHLERNMGEHRAIDAGIAAARGNSVAVIACDGQDDPAYLPKLFAALDGGAEMSALKKTSRRVPQQKQILAKIFYAAFPLLTGIKVKGPAGNYRALGPRVKAHLQRDARPHWPFPLRLEMSPFSSHVIEGEDRKRRNARSTYRFGDSWRLGWRAIQAARGPEKLPSERFTYGDFSTAATLYLECGEHVPQDLLWRRQAGEDQGSGYQIECVFSAEEFSQLQSAMRELLASRDEKVMAQDFFGNYHRHFSESFAHLNFIKSISPGFSIDKFPPELLRKLTGHLQKALGHEITWSPPSGDFPEGFSVRIVRPNTQDANPFHRDTWLPRLRGATNLYIPLFGSDQNSSLKLSPGSHRVPELALLRSPPGAVINGVRYSVPALMGSQYPLNFVRPNPAPGEVLLFSSHLLHGGSTNLNAESTRFSIEMRAWAKEKV